MFTVKEILGKHKINLNHSNLNLYFTNICVNYSKQIIINKNIFSCADKT